MIKQDNTGAAGQGVIDEYRVSLPQMLQFGHKHNVETAGRLKLASKHLLTLRNTSIRSEGVYATNLNKVSLQLSRALDAILIDAGPTNTAATKGGLLDTAHSILKEKNTFDAVGLLSSISLAAGYSKSSIGSLRGSITLEAVASNIAYAYEAVQACLETLPSADPVNSIGRKNQLQGDEAVRVAQKFVDLALDELHALK